MSVDGESEESSLAERFLPTTNNLIRGRDGVYAVGRKLSQGRFGAVFEVLRQSDGKAFAMKLEIVDSRVHALDMDLTVLTAARRAQNEHFAQLVDRGKIEEHFKFIVMTLVSGAVDMRWQLGENLWKQRLKFVDGRFSLSTTLRLALHSLHAIQQLHSLNFVHRDIKASNFALTGHGESLKVFLIDFGLCRHFRDKNGELKPARDNVSFRGTTRYASLAAHRGLEQSPKDDVESWLYMIVEMVSGYLPWSDLHRTERDEVLRRKEEARTSEGAHELLRYCPKVEFRRAFKYVDGLKYASQVDYSFLSQLIQLAIRNNAIKMEEPLDWEE